MAMSSGKAQKTDFLPRGAHQVSSPVLHADNFEAGLSYLP
jgi:hypothetical protein